MQSIEHIIFSTSGRIVLGLLAALLLGVLIFQAGVAAGSRTHPLRAGFPIQGPPPFDQDKLFFLPGGFDAEHGSVGVITSVALPELTLQTRGERSQAVFIGSSTVLRPEGYPTSTVLAPGTRVIIIGSPGEGGLEARFIRALP